MDKNETYINTTGWHRVGSRGTYFEHCETGNVQSYEEWQEDFQDRVAAGEFDGYEVPEFDDWAQDCLIEVEADEFGDWQYS